MHCPHHSPFGSDGCRDSKWVQGPIVAHATAAVALWPVAPITPLAQPKNLAKTFNVTSTVLEGGESQLRNRP